MKVLGIIPARAGSKRLPRKNVLPLCGKPLVCWIIEVALKACNIDRLVVSSDDDEVLQLACRYGPRLALRRPPEFATDTAPAVAYVRHALAVLEEAGEVLFDVVAVLQPTSPLTRTEDIDGTIGLLTSSGADTAVSVVRLDHSVHPVKLKLMQGDRLFAFLEEERGRMAEHELPEVYVRNCAVYATCRHVVEAGEIIGRDCRGFVMPRMRSVDINDLCDFRFAEFLLTAQGS